MFKEMSKKERKLAIMRFAIFFIVITAIIILSIKLLPLITKLSNEESRIEFKEQVSAMGIKGIFLMLGIQILQIVVAVIPGQPVEIISGMLYGTFGGILLCLTLGMIIYIVFFELLPHVLHSKNKILSIIGILIGILIIVISSMFE